MGKGPKLRGPDLERGIPSAKLADGAMLLGHAKGEPVLLARQGRELFAVDATCTHYGGPLAEGLLVGNTVRCPWHHACFNLRTGEAIAPPAFNPLHCWEAVQQGDRLCIRGKLPERKVQRTVQRQAGRAVIVGGGAAGHAAMEALLQAGYPGRITMLSADSAAPYDRPNVSKDYLAGTAPAKWMPMRPRGFYAARGVELRLGARVASLDLANRQVMLEGGRGLPFDALLLATGSDPVRLPLPGGELPHVRYLRTLADARKLIARSESARRAVVLGASFIGLEAAASLRERKITVSVVAPEDPLARVLGPEVSKFIKALHERHGVSFHKGTAARITPEEVRLTDGTSLPADLVVVGVGVKPSVALAEQAGLAMDRGVTVNGYLETSVPGIFAAGDIARWPEVHTGEQIRVEHWVVAERQGRAAAQAMMGLRQPFAAVPFFWSKHYDVALHYVGHVEKWDAIEVAGSLAKKDCVVAYRKAGRIQALVTIGRDRASLEAERAMELNDQHVLNALVRA